MQQYITHSSKALTIFFLISAFSWPNLQETRQESKSNKTKIFKLSNPSKGEKSYNSKKNKPQLIPLKSPKSKIKKVKKSG